jgi:hypothetical protein
MVFSFSLLNATEIRRDVFYYKIQKMDSENKIMELNDGSKWGLSQEAYTPNPYMSYVSNHLLANAISLDNWHEQDEVIIDLNTTWFLGKHFVYKIFNRKTKEYIFANLIGPSDEKAPGIIKMIDIVQEPLTSIGRSISLVSPTIMHLSGTSNEWLIYPEDVEKCLNWEKEDMILIGSVTDYKKLGKIEILSYEHIFSFIEVPFKHLIINTKKGEYVSATPIVRMKDMQYFIPSQVALDKK